MIRVPKNRAPTHPGEMLREEFLAPMQLDEQQWAESIHVPRDRIREKSLKEEALIPALRYGSQNTSACHPTSG